MPSVDVPAIKKSVHADLREMHKATEALAKLLKKRNASSGRDVESQIVDITAAVRERAKGTSGVLREALAMVSEGSSEHKALSTLSEEFRRSLLKFQMQVEATAAVDNPQSYGAGPSDMSSGGTIVPAEQAQLQAQQQQQQQRESLATNESLLRERESGIQQLNQSVHEVAEIFQDLALLVNEQGSQIDNIQTNIETAADSTNRGVRELQRASRSQRRARARMCIIAACVLVVLVVLVLVLRFGLHKLG